MEIRASAEDYLETIYLLLKKTGSVRSIDVAGETGFSKPSVSVAMRKLRESGMISMGADGLITLTPSGLTAAQSVYERHSTLYEWLTQNGISQKQAALDACRMEHVLSNETFQMIKRLAEKQQPPKD